MRIKFFRTHKHQKPNQLAANKARRDAGKRDYTYAVKRSQLRRKAQGKKNWSKNSIFD